MADQAHKDRLVAALTELGGSAGNGHLRETLQWDEATYNAVRDDLVITPEWQQSQLRGGTFQGCRQAARQYGAVGLQARRPWVDFPQEHLRQLRG
jgi:hypothetical protein